MSVEFEAEARLELRQAARWYEGQRSGLGFEFMAEVRRAGRNFRASRKVAETDQTRAPIPAESLPLLDRLSATRRWSAYRRGHASEPPSELLAGARKPDAATWLVQTHCCRINRQVILYRKIGTSALPLQ